MNKILFNFLVVGVSVVAIQSASAVKGGTNVLEERDVNTQVKRIPSAPIKKSKLSAGKKIAENSDGKFELRGINLWMKDDSTGIELPKQRDLKHTVALEASAVKVAHKPLEKRDVNTQVKRIPSAPIKNNRLSVAEKVAGNSGGLFVKRGINLWMKDESARTVLATQSEIVHAPALAAFAVQGGHEPLEENVPQPGNIPAIIVTFCE